jgi:hypothetical protein
MSAIHTYRRLPLLLVIITFVQMASPASGQLAGQRSRRDLVIAPGQPSPLVVVAAAAGPSEKSAAQDLARYVTMMCRTPVDITGSSDEVTAALSSNHKGVLLIVGQAALRAEPGLQQALDKVAKQDPVLRADAIVLRRKGNRVYLAGTNDESHYYAVSRLLHLWGCRWYLATELGECIPEHPRLEVGKLDESYAPPFEARRYWISWNGDGNGSPEFRLRNFMSSVVVPCGHTLAKYVGDLVPPGKSAYNIPVADPKTAEHVARQVVDQYGRGQHVMMGMEDGTYTSDFPLDNELKAGLYDKYFQTQVLTDSFLVFYNNLAGHLVKAHPDSRAKIGFLAYINLTVPPQRNIIAAKPLVSYLAPIDIDPIHGMDDPRSPPRQEYREVMYRWSEVMEGRVVIYDYDQGMLVWRDLPNPSHMAFRQDVQHYRDAGILGVDTESRHATATVFTNLFFRAQLLWNPDVDVDAEMAGFFPNFYGPLAAEPMRAYWTAIYDAWENTICQEHEYFVAPAIYTPELIETLRGHLARAEASIKPLAGKSQPSLNEQRWLERMKFTRLSFGIIDNYMRMVRKAATEVDYQAAAASGQLALKLRDQLTALNGTTTTYRLPGQPGTKIMENGPAWFFGETQQYATLHEFTNGTQGKLLKNLPLEWAFRRDPHDAGLSRHFAGQPADLTFWNANRTRFATPGSRKDYPTTQWEMIRTDLYPQAQGVLHPDWQAFTGFMWSKTDVKLHKDQAKGAVHLKFPGLFAEAWLYVNGYLVQHREQRGMWWNNDYTFEWDVDLTGKLRPGTNDITLRTNCTHHVGGMFRRPFLYRPVPQ